VLAIPKRQWELVTQADLETAAKSAEKAKPFIEGKTIKKVIVVPKKLVNLIAA